MARLSPETEYQQVRCERTIWKPWRKMLGPCHKLLFEGELEGRIRCKKCRYYHYMNVSPRDFDGDKVRCQHLRKKKWMDDPEPCGRLLFEGSMVGKIRCITCGHTTHFKP